MAIKSKGDARAFSFIQYIHIIIIKKEKRKAAQNVIHKYIIHIHMYILNGSVLNIFT